MSAKIQCARAATAPKKCPRLVVHSRGTFQRKPALRVVAFKDTHRAEQLLQCSQEFAKLWKHAQTYGLTPSIKHDLAEIVDTNVVVMKHEPTKHTKAVGVDQMQLLMPNFDEGVDMTACRVLLAAANEDSDTVFMLMGPDAMRTMGNGTFNAAMQYQLIKLDFMYDDTARRIIAITHRATMHAGNPKAMPMPLKRIRNLGGNANGVQTRMHAAIANWCRAMSSGMDMDKIMAPNMGKDFQVWDAYGFMAQQPPMPADSGMTMMSGGAGQAPATKPIMMIPSMGGYDTMTKYMKAVAKSITTAAGGGTAMETRLMDYAVSDEKAAAFCHWISTASVAAPSGGKPAKMPMARSMEGMQVMMFDNEGKMTDVWMFSDKPN